MKDILDFLTGPGAIFSLTLLILGSARLIIMVIIDLAGITRKAGDKAIEYRDALSGTVSWIVPGRRILGTAPLFSVVSFLFHAGLIITPLFLLEHVMLVTKYSGFSWMTLPRMIADMTTLLVAFAGFFLLANRIASRQRRSISTSSHYILSALILIVFLSGFLAHRSWNPFSYTSVMIIHALSGNILMLLVPFTRLSHAILFPLARLITAGAWHFRDVPARSSRAMSSSKAASPE